MLILAVVIWITFEFLDDSIVAGHAVEQMNVSNTDPNSEYSDKSLHIEDVNAIPMHLAN